MAVHWAHVILRGRTRPGASISFVISSRLTDAREIAAESAAEKLISPTDVDGIHDESGKAMSSLNIVMAEDLSMSRAASGGTVAEIEARALEL